MGRFICDFGLNEDERVSLVTNEGLSDMSISDIELCKYSMDDIKKYVQEINKAGVGIVYVNSIIGYKCVDMSEITKIFVLAKQAKIKFVSCYGYSSKSELGIDDACEQYKAIVTLAKQYGIVLLVRNHHNTILNKADKLMYFVKKLNASNVKIFFDTAEFVRCGEIIMPAYRHVKEEVGLVYLSDINIFNDEVPFGMGKCKISDYIAVLKKDGYKGMVSINIAFPTYGRREEIYKKANFFTKLKKDYKSCALIDAKLGKNKKDEVTLKYLTSLQIRYIKKIF